MKHYICKAAEKGASKKLLSELSIEKSSCALVSKLVCGSQLKNSMNR